MIEELLGLPQKQDDIVFTVIDCDFKKNLKVRIDSMSYDRWKCYFEEGNVYNFIRHSSSDDSSKWQNDPMELWDYQRMGQQEFETILPQILVYYWHNDKKLSMELDW